MANAAQPGQGSGDRQGLLGYRHDDHCGVRNKRGIQARLWRVGYFVA
jgi:hypothetical protein